MGVKPPARYPDRWRFFYASCLSGNGFPRQQLFAGEHLAVANLKYTKVERKIAKTAVSSTHFSVFKN
jgi:hypothetical protein